LGGHTDANSQLEGILVRRQNSFANSIRKLATQAIGRNMAAKPSFECLEARQLMAVDVILEWNDVMLQANANDYAMLAPEQAGQIKTSHAFAIVSGAMYDALNSVENVGDQFSFTAKRGRGADVNAAVAQAAHDTLLSLYPSQKQFLDTALQKTLDRIVDGTAESSGVRIGAEVAFAILAARATDGINSISNPNYSPKNLVGFHNVDPLHPNQGVYGSGASNIDGFVIDDFAGFAVPSLDNGTAAGRASFLQSDAYTQAYDEVKTLGGDGVNSPTSRTAEQTLIGQFWGYDGRPGLGTAPRLYNQIATVIAKQMGTSEAENARLFALINIAMADAGIAAWTSKYDADFWRPILAIREGEQDGNPNTVGDATWTPLGAPASNPRNGDTNFTPNFPAYVSGHATFGAATFETLKSFFSTDKISFSFVSDEFNGTTVDASGAIRPRVERAFDSLTAAKLENAKSRVYLGIEWDFDVEAGLDLGDSIADFVYSNALRPIVSQNSDPWNSPDRRFRHNGFDPEDVNNDGDVNPLDALMLINALNNKDDLSNPEDFMDVNDDRDQSPLDVLLVINRINASQHDSNDRSTTDPNTLPSGSRSYDGTGNNLLHTQWGSTDEQLIRVAPAQYGDGISTPAGADRPSARTISNALSNHVAEATPSDRQMSAYIYVWGQFIDHDLGLTKSATPRESFNISVPSNDAEFDPTGSGNQTIPMTRSIYDTTTGTSTANPRQQISQVTAWIDGSMVYGSDAFRAATLRTFVGGKMKSQSTAVGELLPLNSDGLTMANDAHRVPDSQLFAAGDIRANENIELTAMQVLFVREHNRIAVKLAAEQPQLTDEQLYQKARELVIAELQAITYNQWLPALIGTNALSAYHGYNPAVNPGIANEFSTAAYRLHSSINDDVEFFDNAGRPISFNFINDSGQKVAVDGKVSLTEAFFNPTLFKQTGVEGILKYAASTRAEEIDTQVVGSLRNFLFGAPGQGGLDLASLNIQRGRDHGLADYNSIRAAYGLPRVSSFAQITSDVELQEKLATLYGTVDNIDAWVGLLAEDHARGASVSTTSQRIIADQFQRVRDGDRFWYERVFSGRQLAELQRTTLEDVIERNTGVTSLQENVFFFRAELSGQVYYDLNGNSQMDRREKYASRITVELLNDSGEVIGQAVTDRFGRYFLNNIPETGDFRVRVIAPAGMEVTTASELDAHIISGDVRLPNLNFGLRAVT
jgi:peroxidase